MLDSHLIFMLALFIIALLVRDDFIFTIVYLLAGVYIIGRIWTSQVLRGLAQERIFTDRAFCGEEIPVQLIVRNQGWLPLVWLHLVESLPVEVAPPNPLRQVLSLGPRRQVQFQYSLKARKRGYFKIGPLKASTGDLLGLAGEQRWESDQDALIVYPRLIRLTSFRLPSSSPLGTLKYTWPVYEDPNRVLGKRPYTTGDSLRRVDWKATANTGHLQVKQYDPSISLTSSIILGLNLAEYHQRGWVDATELAITVAASIADWVVRNKQYAGLSTNGIDTYSVSDEDDVAQESSFTSIPPRKGQAHLMRILETLARLQTRETHPLVALVRQETQQLPWGTTLVLINGQAGEPLFDEIFRCRRAGLNVVLILVGQVAGIRAVKQRCQHFNIPMYHIRNELDLDCWRQ